MDSILLYILLWGPKIYFQRQKIKTTHALFFVNLTLGDVIRLVLIFYYLLLICTIRNFFISEINLYTNL